MGRGRMEIRGKEGVSQEKKNTNVGKLWEGKRGGKSRLEKIRMKAAKL